jgi:hypothetical protein
VKNSVDTQGFSKCEHAEISRDRALALFSTIEKGSLRRKLSLFFLLFVFFFLLLVNRLANNQNENEDYKQKGTDDENGTQMITLRVPKKLLKAFDERTPDGKRTEKFLSLMEKDLTDNGNGDAIAEAKYAKASQAAEDNRRTIDRLTKALNGRKANIESIVFRTMPDSEENLQKALDILFDYKPKETDGFSQHHKEDYIKILEARIANAKIQPSLNKYRAQKKKAAISSEVAVASPEKEKSKSPSKYIAPKDRCACGGLHGPHTRLEHNRQCYFKQSLHHLDIPDQNENYSTPKGILRRLNNMGPALCTSFEERAILVDHARRTGKESLKILVNSFFHDILLPRPFPESVTYETVGDYFIKNKIVTEDLDCEELRTRLLTKQEFRHYQEEEKKCTWTPTDVAPITDNNDDKEEDEADDTSEEEEEEY